MQSPYARPKDSAFRLGIENIQNDATTSLFAGDKDEPSIVLVANHASVDQMGNRTLDLLLEKKMRVTKVIMPMTQQQSNTAQSKYTQDDATGIAIENLYDTSHQIDKQLFAQADLIVFDVPDISLSYGAYLKLLSEMLLIAKDMKKAIVILDRPNLSGTKMEGALADTTSSSIAVPLRSGMTSGELAQYINKTVLDAKVDLRVVPMCHYRRSYHEQGELLEHLAHTELPACVSSGCSFLGLISQVAPFEVGIGTDRAFECLLLPESIPFERQKWYELQVVLRDMGIKSRFHRQFCASKREYCCGLLFGMQSVREYSAFNTLLTVLSFFKKSGLELGFSACFDTAVGTPLVREVVQGIKRWESLEEKVNTDLQTFFNNARDSFIYQPLPELVFV